MTSDLPWNAGIAWTVDLVDDVGEPVATLGTGDGTVGPISRTLITPALAPQVEDGFYIVALRVALSTDETALAYVHIVVADGRMREMDVGDWREQSRAIFAIPADDVAVALAGVRQ